MTATALELEIDTPQATSIVALVEANPVMVLTDREKFSRFYEEIKRETDALDADVTTERGRKAIASMAYKVARTKTAIDDAGKKLNEEARARINAVDESRREIRAQLDALKDEVRAPLTEWERAEELRVDRCKQTLVLLRDSASVGYEETAADVRKRLDHISGLSFNETDHADYLPQLAALKEQTVTALTAAIDRLDREEKERAELEKLRAEAAERERAEQERKATEEAEAARVAAEQAEAKRKADAEAQEQARMEAAAKAAEEKARREAEEKAEQERAEERRKHEEALAAERRRAEQAEAAEAARKQAEAQAAEEQAKREADQQHRSAVLKAAKEAIMSAGSIDEPSAKAIVLAIRAGEVPRTTISF